VPEHGCAFQRVDAALDREGEAVRDDDDITPGDGANGAIQP
jgi:hypothetical protein